MDITVIVFSLIALFSNTEAGFNNNPGTVFVHENRDSVTNIWDVRATCNIRYTCGYTCYYDCSYYVHTRTNFLWWTEYRQRYVERTCSTTCYTTCSTNVQCDVCALTNDAGIFKMSGNLLIQKIKCSNGGCGPTCSASGCLTHHQRYQGTVQCWRSSYPSMTYNGRISNTFYMETTENVAPYIDYFQNGNPCHVYKSSATTGTVVNKIVSKDNDAYIDSDYVRNTHLSGPEPSHVHGNTLFAMHSDGSIYVTSDLSLEFSWVYEMTLKVHDRREQFNTATLTISLHACYQTPNCSAQANHGFIDTHGSHTGHGDGDDTLFDMIYPQPDANFKRFRSTWEQLQWTFVWTVNSHSEITQDYLTGKISATGNLSVYPSWPSKTFQLEVTVGNKESCTYTSTCLMDFTIHYTNWPINILNDPPSDKHEFFEDDEDENNFYNFTIFDYNYYWEDTVTCYITSIDPPETNMFELRNEDHGDGTFAYNSWELWRLPCWYRDCGYKYDPSGAFLCYTNSGCFNHNITQQYIIYVTCDDYYNSSDSTYVVVDIVKNKAPMYLNLPRTVTLDTDTVAHHDIIHASTYWDYENENLHYEYTHLPVDHGWFLGDAFGNYYDNLANISMTTYLHNLTTNETFTTTVCAHERRNEICKDLTIQLRSNCGEVPTCSDQTITVDVDFAVGGTLFNPIVTSSHSGSTYGIASDHPGYFAVDENTGAVTTLQALAAAGTNQARYGITNFIYHAASCGYGSCSYTVFVNPLNKPISIDNLAATVDIHEDTRDKQVLFWLMTSDEDTDDDVYCDVTNITPAPEDPPLFFVEQTYAGSKEYVICNRELPDFNSTIQQYTVSVQCTDNRGSTSSGVLTVDIILNVAPTFQNLPNSISLDPFTVVDNQIIYTVSATDTENDVISYRCEVADSFVPFTCDSTNSNEVVMRRTVDIVDENGVSYAITVYIGDAKHTDSSSAVLTVNFDSSMTLPEISNLDDSVDIPESTIAGSVTLPEISNLDDSVDIPESTAAGTLIFQLSVTDPDVGDTHTYVLLEVSPASSSSAFYVTPSGGAVVTNTTFNYENQASYTLTFTVRDQDVDTSATWSLTVNIVDENEAPTLTADTTAFNFSEDAEVGTVFDPGFTVTDPDVGDSRVFSVSGTYSDAFSIRTGTGKLELTKAWDLESAYPVESFLIVACTDSGGLSATVIITLYIAPVNEFAPDCTFLYPYGTNPEISANTSLNNKFLIISAIDNDVFSDGTFSMTVLSPDASNTNSRGSYYFYVRTGRDGSTGDLLLRRPASFNSNGTMVVNVQVSDGDSPAMTCGTTMTFTYIAADPTVQGKEEKCVTCTTNGRVLIAVTCIEGVIVALLVAHVIWNFVFRKDFVSNIKNRRRNNTSNTDTLLSTISGSRFTRLGPGNSGFSRATAAGALGVTGATAGGALAASQAANNGMSRQGRSIEISDDDMSSVSDTDSDDSGPFRNQSRSNQPGRTNFNNRAGLPPPVYAANAASTGLPSPVYSSNVTSPTHNPQSSSNSNSRTGTSRSNPTSQASRASRVVNPPRSNQPVNPFSNPDMFRPNVV